MTQPEGSSRVDVQEHGANQQTSTRRLYMQLQVFGDCDDPKRLTGALERARVEGVLYADVADPLGVAVLGIAEDPAFFVGRWRELLGTEPFLGLRRKPELTMFGRTYSSGFETDLEDWLLARPRRTALGAGVAVGNLVSPPPDRDVRAAHAPGAGRDPQGARRARAHVRRGRPRARRPARLPRARHPRQRLRDRARGAGAAPALAPGADDAPHGADLGVHPDARPLLRRPRALARIRGADPGTAAAAAASRLAPRSARWLRQGSREVRAAHEVAIDPPGGAPPLGDRPHDQ